MAFRYVRFSNLCGYADYYCFVLLTDLAVSFAEQIGNKRLKVQHKQIRRQDLSDQDSLQDGFGGGSYQRYSMSSLPPSGPNANQHIWFDTARGMESLDDTPESHHQQLLEQDSVAGHDGKSSSGGDLASEDNSEQASPLANLSQLQNALPDIPGNGSSE